MGLVVVGLIFHVFPQSRRWPHSFFTEGREDRQELKSNPHP